MSIRMTHHIYSSTFSFSLSDFGQTTLVVKEVTVINASMLLLLFFLSSG